MRPSLLRLLPLLALACPVAAAGLSTVRAYPLPAGGSLELTVPMRWQEEITWSPGEPWPRLAFRPPTGEDFALALTAIPADRAQADAARPDAVRNLVDRSARAALGVGPEADLLLEQFDGRQGPGWFYSVADETVPDPAPAGVFRVMTQGAIAVEDMLLSATVLTQLRSSPDLAAAIDMLRGARVTDLPGDSWRQPTQSHRDRGGVGERYEFDAPEGFSIESRSPLLARDDETEGLLVVNVELRRSTVKEEARRLPSALDLRSPGGWILRRQGRIQVGGAAAAELVAMDEHRDQAIHFVAVPREDFVLVLEWRVAPSMEQAGRARLQAALDAMRFPDRAPVAAAAPAKP